MPDAGFHTELWFSEEGRGLYFYYIIYILEMNSVIYYIVNTIFKALEPSAVSTPQSVARVRHLK